MFEPQLEKVVGLDEEYYEDIPWTNSEGFVNESENSAEDKPNELPAEDWMSVGLVEQHMIAGWKRHVLNSNEPHPATTSVTITLGTKRAKYVANLLSSLREENRIIVRVAEPSLKDFMDVMLRRTTSLTLAQNDLFPETEDKVEQALQTTRIAINVVVK